MRLYLLFFILFFSSSLSGKIIFIVPEENEAAYRPLITDALLKKPAITQTTEIRIVSEKSPLSSKEFSEKNLRCVVFGISGLAQAEKLIPSSCQSLVFGVPAEKIPSTKKENMIFVPLVPELSDTIRAIRQNFRFSSFYYLTEKDIFPASVEVTVLKVSSRIHALDVFRKNAEKNRVFIVSGDSVFIDRSVVQKLISLALRQDALLVFPYPALAKSGAFASVCFDYPGVISSCIRAFAENNDPLIPLQIKMTVNKNIFERVKEFREGDNYDFF